MGNQTSDLPVQFAHRSLDGYAHTRCRLAACLSELIIAHITIASLGASYPFFAKNRERPLFKDLRSFSFADGSRLDFAGDPHRGHGRARTLSDSDERVWKGFAPTFHLERNYLGLAVYRLDWLLVKVDKDHDRTDLPQACNPKTLTAFTELGKEQLSDHQPTVLHLRYPSRGTTATVQRP